MDDEFVTMRQAQEILGVSNFTIWKMVKDGRLTAYRSGVDRRQKLIRRADLERIARVEPIDEEPCRSTSPADLSDRGPTSQ